MNVASSALNLTLSDPQAIHHYTVTLNAGASLSELGRALATAQQLSLGPDGVVIGDLFRGPAPSVFFYYPRHRVLDPNGTLAQNHVTAQETLYYYQPGSLPTGLGAIALAHGRSLADEAILLVIEHKAQHYPVVVPARLGPSAAAVPGLLRDVIYRQLTDLGVADLPDPADPATTLIHDLTGQAIATETATDLADFLHHGDLVHLRAAGEDNPSVAAPEPLEETIELEDAIELEEELLAVDPIAQLVNEIEIEDATPITFGGAAASPLSTSRRVLNIGRATLELTRDDITRQATDAVVNPALPTLSGAGGGIDGVIHAAAGPDLARAGHALGRCLPGSAVLTPGYRLPTRWVIHTVGPLYQDGQHGEPQLLAQAYISSLTIARDSGFQSITFPSIGTGIYRFPLAEAAAIALKTCVDWLGKHDAPLLVRFALATDVGFAAYAAALDQLAPTLAPLAPASATPNDPPFFTLEDPS
jgi:O-acetyl-ADP-ribose deacetylase